MGMTAEYRLIVTGSREYSDALSLIAALTRVLQSLPAGVTLVVVHGGEENADYSTNADRIAQEWATEMEREGRPVRQEPHPAGWEEPCRPSCEAGHRQAWRGRSVCPAAGPYRNAEMVDEGADKVLGALKVGTRSTGSRGCLLLAASAGIPVELVVEGRGVLDLPGVLGQPFGSRLPGLSG